MLIPKLSSIIFKTGAIQFVVQDAAEKIFRFSISKFLLFIPYTIFGISVPGAVSRTFLIPLDFKWQSNASLEVNAPVLSIRRALFISYDS